MAQVRRINKATIERLPHEPLIVLRCQIGLELAVDIIPYREDAVAAYQLCQNIAIVEAVGKPQARPKPILHQREKASAMISQYYPN